MEKKRKRNFEGFENSESKDKFDFKQYIRL